MTAITYRQQLEAYAWKKYQIEPEQLPFNHEDYSVLRHPKNGKWFAVFIVKTRREFGLAGEGITEIVSVKTRDPFLVDTLAKQPGFLRGFPSSGWNWLSVVLDGTVPIEDIYHFLDESYQITKNKTGNQNTPLLKRKEALSD